MISSIYNKEVTPSGGLPARIYFQNIRGLGNKRAKLISSDLADYYDIFLFNESFSTKEQQLTDDWSQIDCIGKVTSFRDSSEFRQGLFVAYKSHLKVTFPRNPILDRKHEISIMKVSTEHSSLHIVLYYKSPSMSPDQSEAFCIRPDQKRHPARLLFW